MASPLLDWTDVSLPVSGRSPQARHASFSGAQRAARDRGALLIAYLALLREVGPLSDPESARALGRPISSICSTRNGLGSLVIASGDFEITEWHTRRVRWTVARLSRDGDRER